jgi:lipopolysaccharide export system protein LptA
MRRTRRLILLLLAVIVSGVAFLYYLQKTTQARNAPDKPASLPDSVISTANDWVHSEKHNGIPSYEVRAKNYRMDSTGSRVELEGVTLKMFSKDGKTFDEVKSAKAEFDTNQALLFSEGDVQITMGVGADPAEAAKQQGRLIVINTSAVHFESKTGKAWTEQSASFKFDKGEGKSVGAEYDPSTKELHMRKDVELKWFDAEKPMEIQAGSLVYKEAESKVWLLDWSKFKRATLSMDAGPAIVTIEKGAIRAVEAANAHGEDVQPLRKVQYAADHLDLKFTPKGAVDDVVGDGNAKLISTVATGETTVTSNRLDLDFDLAGDETTLKKATAVGKTVVESKPAPRPNMPLADTRVLRSEVVAMYMRTGGEEIDHVQAEAPGTIDFLPNRPGQKKRHMEGDGITIQYGPENQIQSFSATSVTTRTESEPVKGKPQPPAITSSKGMSAQFEPKTGTLTNLEQWDNFKYQEGDRQAKADRAVLDQAKDQIALTGSARFWDLTGSTSAHTILLTQKTGDVQAEGDVTSTRLPDKKEKKPAQQSGSMLSGDEPVQAKAARMTSTDRNQQIRYEGDALMWQGSNRLQANRIDIDRKNSRLRAEGAVVSQLLDKAETQKQKKGSIFTVVRAPRMEYLDKERLAHYTGGVVLTRGTMVVNANELRAFLKEDEKDGGSSLDHAIADGSVKIVDTTPLRTRTGTSEHAEYYVTDAKITLQGGQPQMMDSIKGTTRGRQLTYFSNSDKLIVQGIEGQPVESRILKK